MGRSVPPLGRAAASFRLGRSWPVLVLVVALGLRLWGIEWQLPAAVYFDEMKYVEWAGDAKDEPGETVKDLRNPTLFHHLLQAEYAVASLFQRGATPQQVAVSELKLARLTSAVMGSLACLLTALAAQAVARAAGLRPVAARTAGLAAGLILAVATLHVHLSHYAVNDAAASLFLAATLLFGSRALGSGASRDLALAGAAAGLAFSTKYSFAVGLVLPLVASLAPATAKRSPTPQPPPPCAGEGETRYLPPFPRARGRGDSGAPWWDGWGLGGRGSLLHGARPVLLVLAAFVIGAVAGAPEIILSPNAVLAGVMEQARLGGERWNGQSDAPVWQLYAETLGHGFGWTSLAMAAVGCVALGRRNVGALLAVLAVPVICLGVMLRQELFFARFALPLLPPLAMLAGLGVVAVVALAVRGYQTRTAFVAGLAALVMVGVLLPGTLITIRHNQLATMTDTRVLARRWLNQRGDGARVATELYGQPLLWAGSVSPRGFRMQRVGSFVDRDTVRKLSCDGTRLFLVASITEEREVARRGSRGGETGYDVLARLGQPKAVFDPFQPGRFAPAHPDNTGLPFWYLDAYARPGPRITIYELPEGSVNCSR